MGLRIGKNPQVICTTTPRPIKIIRDLIKDKRTVETRGTTIDNADNLHPLFIERMHTKYDGTRLGRQEIGGEILDDNPEALWKRVDIDNNRVRNIPELSYVVVGVDPAVTSKDGSDDTGIVAAGKDQNNHGYILGDFTIHDSPQKWAHAAITAYNHQEANVIVGEVNNGGDLVEMNIKTVDPSVPFKAVHASRGKAIRAEPISALYEQNVYIISERSQSWRINFVNGCLVLGSRRTALMLLCGLLQCLISIPTLEIRMYPVMEKWVFLVLQKMSITGCLKTTLDSTFGLKSQHLSFFTISIT